MKEIPNQSCYHDSLVMLQVLLVLSTSAGFHALTRVLGSLLSFMLFVYPHSDSVFLVPYLSEVMRALVIHLRITFCL